MKIPILKLTERQKIFLLSKANGGTDNHQDLLPNNGWTWPRQTWLQTRRDELKKERGDEG